MSYQSSRRGSGKSAGPGNQSSLVSMPLSIGLSSVGTSTLSKQKTPSELLPSTLNLSTWGCRDARGSRPVQVDFRLNTGVKCRTRTMHFPMPLNKLGFSKEWQEMSGSLNSCNSSDVKFARIIPQLSPVKNSKIIECQRLRLLFFILYAVVESDLSCGGIFFVGV